MRRALPASLIGLAGAVAFAGCLGGDPDDETDRAPRSEVAPRKAPRSDATPKKTRDEPTEGRAIRAWSKALNAGRYGRAADFFARGAIVEQVAEVRLPNRTAAIAFNRGLPCRAQVTEVERDGKEIVAGFDLSKGRGPSSVCQGDARVRFRFKGGKFSEWRQDVDRPSPPGRAA